jgi:tyrosine-protein phosphatase YwqE
LFAIFNRKPFLRDFIPPGHTDFHSHLLPGIDDGAASFEDTRTIITRLMSFGCSRFIATPHVMNNVWENTRESIEETLQSTRTALTAAGISIPLNAAAEYLIDDHFVKLYTTNQLRTLKDNYVLVEMSYLNPPIQLYQILFDVQVAGYIPVLAHPERYIFFHNNFPEYQKLKNAGCLFQLNLLSTVGYYGVEVAAVASKLLNAGMIDFAGSDVHHENHLEAFEKRIVIKNGASISAALKNNSVFSF